MLKTLNEEEWQIVTDTWWHTRYEAVSWAFNQRPYAEGAGKKSRFQGSLFSFSLGKPHHTARKRDASVALKSDLTLSTSLCGVQCAMDALASYEADVGFSSVALPFEEANQMDLSVEVDKETISRSRKKWDIYAELLTCGEGMKPTANDDTASRASSPSSSTQGDLHRSTSTLSSIGSTDSDLSAHSVSVPSTPKGKSTEAIVQVKDASPHKNDGAIYISSQNRRLNVYASSFIPSKAKQETIIFPASASSVPLPLSTVAFSVPPSDHPPLTAVKITKDEQGFYCEAEVASPTPQSQQAEHSFLPPFLQNSPRRKSSASKTRAMVDRLRSSHSHSHSPGPNPPLYDMSLFDERIYTSEDDRARSSGISSPSSQDDEDEGWVKLDKAARESKARRTRNLFLALTRRRSDPATAHEACDPKPEPEDKQELEIPAAASPTPLVSPLPLSSDCGWIEGPSPPLSSSPLAEITPQRKQSESRTRSHRKRRSSSQATLLPLSSPNIFLPHLMQSTNTPRATPSSGLSHTPFHPPTMAAGSFFSPRQTPATSGFYSTYPSMMSPMTYTTYMQQLHAIQLQMRRQSAIVPHSSVEWAYPTQGVGHFTNTPSTFSQPVSLTASFARGDSIW